MWMTTDPSTVAFLWCGQQTLDRFLHLQKQRGQAQDATTQAR